MKRPSARDPNWEDEVACLRLMEEYHKANKVSREQAETSSTIMIVAVGLIVGCVLFPGYAHRLPYLIAGWVVLAAFALLVQHCEPLAWLIAAGLVAGAIWGLYLVFPKSIVYVGGMAAYFAGVVVWGTVKAKLAQRKADQETLRWRL